MSRVRPRRRGSRGRCRNPGNSGRQFTSFILPRSLGTLNNGTTRRCPSCLKRYTDLSRGLNGLIRGLGRGNLCRGAIVLCTSSRNSRFGAHGHSTRLGKCSSCGHSYRSNYLRIPLIVYNNPFGNNGRIARLIDARDVPGALLTLTNISINSGVVNRGLLSIIRGGGRGETGRICTRVSRDHYNHYVHATSCVCSICTPNIGNNRTTTSSICTSSFLCSVRGSP